MNPALVSLLALVVAIVLSMTSRINVGLLAVALAWVIGTYVAGLKPDAPMDPLFIMRTAPGRTDRTFGGADDDDPTPPALIDVIVPPGASQEKLLSDSNLKARTLPKLPAVVPAKVPAAK